MDTLRRRAIKRLKNDSSELSSAIYAARQRGFVIGDIELCHALNDVYDVGCHISNTATLAMVLLEESMSENIVGLSAELRAESDRHMKILKKVADRIEQMYADAELAKVEFAVAHTVPYRSQWDSDAKQFNSDCGPACIAMLLSHRGIHRSVDYLSAACGLGESKRYTTAPDLAFVSGLCGSELSVKAGLSAHEWVAESPAIALVHYGTLPDRLDKNYTGGHWVVVVGGDDKFVELHDPDWWGERRDEGTGRRVSIEVFDNALRDCVLDGNPVGYGLA